VALLVFFPGAAWTRIVAADFCPGANWFGRFGLGGAGLILHLFFLALLLAFHFARESGKLRRRFICDASGGAGRGGEGPGRPRTSRYRLPRTTTTFRRCTARSRLISFHLHLHVIEITNGFVIDARHHVFKQNKRFFLEFDERILLSVPA